MTDVYFSSFEQKCVLCQRWQNHRIISSTSQIDIHNHYTCICKVIDNGSVCCYLGFNTLIQDEPDLAVYLVEKIRGSNIFLNLSAISPSILSDDEIELTNRCEVVRQKSIRGC